MLLERGIIVSYETIRCWAAGRHVSSASALPGRTASGAMKLSAISYKTHRFPLQIIAHAVWLCFRFPLSLRLVEEMLLERGIPCHPHSSHPRNRALVHGSLKGRISGHRISANSFIAG